MNYTLSPLITAPFREAEAQLIGTMYLLRTDVLTRLAKKSMVSSSSPISVSNLILVSGPASPSFHNDGYSIDIQHASINGYSPGRLSDFGGTLSDTNLCIERQL